mmetsp:Transcript_25887/g.35867  ORF Transcript_25887/g.35867 Transcript_25887/m.35867 type:complete len:303 (+) Transcript_25887:315-1223(+)
MTSSPTFDIPNTTNDAARMSIGLNPTHINIPKISILVPSPRSASKGIPTDGEVCPRAADMRRNTKRVRGGFKNIRDISNKFGLAVSVPQTKVLTNLKPQSGLLAPRLSTSRRRKRGNKKNMEKMDRVLEWIRRSEEELSSNHSPFAHSEPNFSFSLLSENSHRCYNISPRVIDEQGCLEKLNHLSMSDLKSSIFKSLPSLISSPPSHTRLESRRSACKMAKTERVVPSRRKSKRKYINLTKTDEIPPFEDLIGHHPKLSLTDPDASIKRRAYSIDWESGNNDYSMDFKQQNSCPQLGNRETL